MSAHTPGPWIAIGHWVEHPSRPDICNCDPESMAQDGRSDAEICANARLIAAAPELLVALQRIATMDYGNPYAKGCAELARAAISKATGGAA